LISDLKKIKVKSNTNSTFLFASLPEDVFDEILKVGDMFIY
jgi:hypothetical protein